MRTAQVSPAGHPAAVAQTGVEPMAHVASQVVARAPPPIPNPARQHSWPTLQLSSLEHWSTTPPSAHPPGGTHVCIGIIIPRPRTMQHSIGGSHVVAIPHAIPPASLERRPPLLLLLPAPLLLLLPPPLLLFPAPLLLLPPPLLLPFPAPLLLLPPPLLLPFPAPLLLLPPPLLLPFPAPLLLLPPPPLLLLFPAPLLLPDKPVAGPVSEPLHAGTAAPARVANETTKITCSRFIVRPAY